METIEQDKRSRQARMLRGSGVVGALVLAAGALWLAVPRRHHHQQGNLTACKSNLKNIGIAYEMYSVDNGGKYPSTASLVVPKYLKRMPECPKAGSVTYQVSLGPTAPMNHEAFTDYYYVECYGGNHSDVGVTGNYPAYNSIEGLIERRPLAESRTSGKAPGPAPAATPGNP